jgi:hypothetical protein
MVRPAAAPVSARRHVDAQFFPRSLAPPRLKCGEQVDDVTLVTRARRCWSVAASTSWVGSAVVITCVSTGFFDHGVDAERAGYSAAAGKRPCTVIADLLETRAERR